jgi:hypothetical protein
MPHQTFANSRALFKMLVLSAACIAASVGCGAGEQSAQNDAQLRAGMKLLGLQYGSYLSEKGAPPPDESALRNYLKSRLATLGDYGVKSVDDLLRNGRDGQPLKLFYGTKVPSLEHPEYVWVAHEQTGVAGKRLACDSRGGIYEINDIEYSEQLAGK